MYDTKQVLINCINFIEEKLHERLTLDEIALNAGISKFHLHRLFKSLTGDTIMDYVLGRKLTDSLNYLLQSKMRMIDLAVDYGFDYEQSYIRAFKKKFGSTPFQVKKRNYSLVLQEKININDIMSLGNTITYKPFFVIKPKFFLAGVQNKIISKSGDNAANILGKNFFYKERENIKQAIKPDIYYGYTDWSANENGYIYYVPSIQVPDLASVPGNMTGITIPAHKYVVFRFIGFFKPDEIKGRQIGRVLVELYSKWIFRSGYRFAAPFRFEYIDTSLSRDDYCELDIYQPICDIDNSTNK